MKRWAILSLFLLCASCASFADTMTGTKSSWSPYIGCPENELYQNWGIGGDSSYYESAYTDMKQVWFHKNLLFGGVFPGYTMDDWCSNILVTITDGKISSISYH